MSQPPPKREDRDVGSTIYVSGLPNQINESDLRTVFEKCGKIQGIRIPKDRQAGEARGFAYVEFASQVGQDKIKKDFFLKCKIVGQDKKKGDFFFKL